MTYTGDGNLDNVDDRMARHIIADWLQELAEEPHMDLDKLMPYHRHLSERLKKIALAIDAGYGANRGGDTFENARQDLGPDAFQKMYACNPTVGAKLSDTKPGGLDWVKLKELALHPVDLPRMIQCDYLDGLKDEDGNPAAFIINDAAIQMPMMTVARTPGKTMNLVLMTPQFAELVAKAAAKHAIKIHIEGRKP